MRILSFCTRGGEKEKNRKCKDDICFDFGENFLPRGGEEEGE